MTTSPKPPSSGIYWLASYPKSGNTWFRLFLRNYLSDAKQPHDINESRDKEVIASLREAFDAMSGLESALLTHDECERLKPATIEQWASTTKENLFLKIHDACCEVSHGMPVVSIKGTKGAVYILRNPLDVAISFAHHENCCIDEMIDKMQKGNTGLRISEKNRGNQLRQNLRDWSGHVSSWVDNPWFPVEVLRYEDMKEFPFEAFGRAVRFLGLPYDEERLRKAILFSDFNELQRQEQEKGFIEKSSVSEVFFRKGEAGQWKEVLTQEQIQRIVENHGKMMKRFGYLNDIDPEILKGIAP